MQAAAGFSLGETRDLEFYAGQTRKRRRVFLGVMRYRGVSTPEVINGFLREVLVHSHVSDKSFC